MLTVWPLLLIAYLLGSLSSAVIVCKLMGLPDPRHMGSGNPGATNVLRVGGKKAAAITLAGDALKGFIPAIIARLLGIEGLYLSLVALAAVLGHLYPCFFQFKGGKGVATILGASYGINWWVGVLMSVIWFITAAVTRYSSLSSLIATASAPILAWIFGGFAFSLPVFAMAAIIIYRHKENIDRLRQGKERKIGEPRD